MPSGESLDPSLPLPSCARTQTSSPKPSRPTSPAGTSAGSTAARGSGSVAEAVHQEVESSIGLVPVLAGGQGYAADADQYVVRGDVGAEVAGGGACFEEGFDRADQELEALGVRVGAGGDHRAEGVGHPELPGHVVDVATHPGPQRLGGRLRVEQLVGGLADAG